MDDDKGDDGGDNDSGDVSPCNATESPQVTMTPTHTEHHGHRLKLPVLRLRTKGSKSHDGSDGAMVSSN